MEFRLNVTDITTLASIFRGTLPCGPSTAMSISREYRGVQERRVDLSDDRNIRED